MSKIKSYIVVGIGFGDECKGGTVNQLCWQYKPSWVVRYNGGSQAGHNVHTIDGRHHTFSQFGSGAFVPRVNTLLSRFMMWDPIALAHEVEELSPKIGENALNRHFIDERSPVITIFHVFSNRLKEWSRGDGRHGSCGKGIGELAYDLINYQGEVIIASCLSHPALLQKKMRQIRDRKRSVLSSLGIDFSNLPEFLEGAYKIFWEDGELDKITDAYIEMGKEYNILSKNDVNSVFRNESAVFEGAQGLLLDEWWGFHPYTTWSNISPYNALILLRESMFNGEKEVIGVTRSYHTRHGAGPFPTDDPSLAHIYPGEDNNVNDWQGNFRVGSLDGVLLRYAIGCLRGDLRLDCLAVTHLDAIERISKLPYTDRYLFPPNTPTLMLRDFEAKASGILASTLQCGRYGDLEYQGHLTNLLKTVIPETSGSFSSSGEVIEYIEQITKVPVKYTSASKTMERRKVLC